MAKVLSLDLEGNQPSGKIIQIGYVIADINNGRIFQKRSLIVNPHEPLGIIPNNGIHISDFTGITQERIDKEGMELKDAYQILVDDMKKHNPTSTCVQWGDGADDNKGDHDWLRRELGLSWDDFVFRARAWDVKSQFQIWRAFRNKSVVAGLHIALETLGMTFEGREHDALDDAWNTLRVFIGIGSKAVNFDKIVEATKPVELK